jgi:hypothetical protein
VVLNQLYKGAERWDCQACPCLVGNLGCVVARWLVAGTPLEVAAGQVALGREYLQIQAVWVWPVESGSHARRELGCVALMLVTVGISVVHIRRDKLELRSPGLGDNLFEAGTGIVVSDVEIHSKPTCS